MHAPRKNENSQEKISIPLGGTHKFNVDGLLHLGDVVVFAEGFPSLGNHLDQEFPRGKNGHVAHAGLVRLQVHLDLLVFAQFALFDEFHVHAGAIDRLLFLAAGNDDRQARILRDGSVLPSCGVPLVLRAQAHGETQQQRRKNQADIFQCVWIHSHSATLARPSEPPVLHILVLLKESRKQDMFQTRTRLPDARDIIDSAALLSYFQSAHEFSAIHGH